MLNEGTAGNKRLGADAAVVLLVLRVMPLMRLEMRSLHKCLGT